MTITQHAHIYRFHTSKFNFGEIFFLKFLSIQPLSRAGGGAALRRKEVMDDERQRQGNEKRRRRKKRVCVQQYNNLIKNVAASRGKAEAT